MPTTQANRPISVTTPLGSDALTLTQLSFDDALGRPFRGHLMMLAVSGDVDPMDLLGQSISIRLGDADNDPSFINGYVTEFAQLEMDQGYYQYTMAISAWIDLLRHAGGSRIFQQQSVVDIAKAIADERGFSGELEDRLTQTYRQRPYCVQYNESDFDFLSRLFEEEGIYYFFEHDADKHTLVLCDDIGGHQAAPNLATLPYHVTKDTTSEACVSNWTHQRRFLTSSFVMRDYDFQKPRVDLTVRQNSSDTPSSWTWYQFPGRYFESDDGQHYARVRCESASANQSVARVDVSVYGLQAGNLLTIESHPNDDVNQEHLITAYQMHASVPGGMAGSGRDGGFVFSGSVHIQPSCDVYRTPMTTQRPIVAGPQIATIVGPSGEEIWTDNFGRVKVQFAWDLDGVQDDNSSCWVRVTQAWTGKGWGAMSIPRVGDEVMVEFIDGDLDRPIVTGRVINADRMPPEALADGQAKTVFRTRSTKEGDIECFHELTFDDTKDAERIYLHSERDFDRVVENNDTLKVGFDKQDPGDQTIQIFNDQNVEIGLGSGAGSQTIEIAQDRTVTIDSGDDTLNVTQGDLKVATGQGGIDVSAGASISASATQDITLEAQSSITLKCGGSTIELTPSGIKISGADVNINGSASAEVQGGGELTLKGGMVMIN